MMDHKNNVICIKCKYKSPIALPECPMCAYVMSMDDLENWKNIFGLSHDKKDE